MRVKITKSKNSKSYSIIKDIVVNGKRTTKQILSLGNHEDILREHPGLDPYEWAKEYAKQYTDEKDSKRIIKLNSEKIIDKEENKNLNIGYLFLKQIYNALDLEKMCEVISTKQNFTYPLSEILEHLIYGRILHPSSKKESYKYAKKYLEQPSYDSQYVYQALTILNKYKDYIQEYIYKSSKKLVKRNTNILYYDCTNFFFEIEENDGLREYGYSKEHRPNPIVNMGLFLDGSGFPLAFDIFSGSKAECDTLKPIEKKIIKDFGLSQFVVCTDAGLSVYKNRKFNSINNRAFITTQSIKKLSKKEQEWCLSNNGWRLPKSKKEYTLDEINELYATTPNTKLKNKLYNQVFYKEAEVTLGNIKQRMIVTYSLKYKFYKQNLRQNELERLIKKIENGTIDHKDKYGSKRFTKTISYTSEGEVANKKKIIIDEEIIKSEARYDGFYAVSTSLENNITKIIEVNKNRWMIEEVFRLMKTEFKTRPVYVSRDDRIVAHFLTCFISLLIFKILDYKLESEYSYHELITTLTNMNLYRIDREGFIPTYTRTDLTDKLHDVFKFRTDYEFSSEKDLKKVLKMKLK